ncbi:hypothetical protein [Sphingomonas aracearum]|nr:hypothetical protein [Sphingomonas aracearum]
MKISTAFFIGAALLVVDAAASHAGMPSAADPAPAVTLAAR